MSKNRRRLPRTSRNRQRSSASRLDAAIPLSATDVARLHLMIDRIPAVLWTADRQLRFTSSLGAGLADLKLRPSEVVGRTLFEYFGTTDPSFAPIEAHRRALRGESMTYEQAWSGRVYQTHVEPLRGPDGRVRECMGLALDITERKRAEQALRESERSLATLIGNIPGAVYRAKHDRTRTFQFVSQGIFDLTGYLPRDFASGQVRYGELVSPQDRGTIWLQVQAAIKGRRPYHLLYRIRAQDGSRKWAWEQGEAIRSADGELRGVEGIILDITPHQAAEEKLRGAERRFREQLRALTARVESVRERERAQIAREIHDELGQALTGLKLDLSRLSQRMGPTPALRGKDFCLPRIRSMIELVDHTTATVQNLCMKLRPSLLDDLGLAAAMEWELERFESRTGIRCRIPAELPEPSLGRPRTTAVYRVFQEILTNVARHARASRVRVRGEVIDRAYVLEVRDNGRGIRARELDARNSLGILGMKERVRRFGGEIRIEGHANRGTTVRVRMPFPPGRRSRRPLDHPLRRSRSDDSAARKLT